MQQKKAMVDPKFSKQLAFWETLIDIDADNTPAQYLDTGDKVTIIADNVFYAGPHTDKEYCKVRHSMYGLGYMLKEGLVLI